MKDGPRKRHNRKGRGEAEKEVKSREKRCAKIADLIVAGKKGLDLEAAIQEYDHEHGVSVKTKEEEPSAGTNAKIDRQDMKDVTVSGPEAPSPARNDVGDATLQSSTFVPMRSKTPNVASEVKFKVPLTAMFKRSSSAPAAQKRGVGRQYHSAGRRASLSAVPSFSIFDPAVNAGDAFSLTNHEGQPRVDSNVDILDELKSGLVSECVAAMQPSGLPGLELDLQHASGKWNDVSSILCIGSLID